MFVSKFSAQCGCDCKRGEFNYDHTTALRKCISTRFVGKPEGGGVSNVFLTCFDYFFVGVNTNLGVERPEAPPEGVNPSPAPPRPALHLPPSPTNRALNCMRKWSWLEFVNNI